MKTVDVWVGDDGPKMLEDMTKEELMAAVRELGEMLRAKRRLAREEREFWSGLPRV